MFNVIHVAHEAVHKLGGIGTVLEGLINSRPYRDEVGRTVLVAPLIEPERAERLGPGGVIEYSSVDHISEGPYAAALGRVEADWSVRLVYGRRPVHDEPSARRTLCEVLLVDLRGVNMAAVNAMKGRLWEHFGLHSDRYEHVAEFELAVRLAAPAAPALEALRMATSEAPAIVFAHEYVGVPLGLALQGDFGQRYHTLFYAHETSPVRRIVEGHPGHDVMFYNALDAARKNGLHLEDVFGPQHDYFKHALVEAARYCDGHVAVGHHVQREMRFLSPQYEESDVTLAYNGVPVADVTLAEKHVSRARIRDYCQTLLGWRPDFLFTRVTRLATGKALWRDLDVLAAMDGELERRGQTAVLLSLTTETAGRTPGEIRYMEEQWDWPLAHREGFPDLTPGEAHYHRQVQAFNARARRVKAIFINQFGFDPVRAGRRVPPDTEFLDLRRATHAEFGLSLYEPFGMSPLEPLTFGGLCVISTSCGCSGFVQQATGRRRAPNVLLANYINELRRPRSVRDALEIGETDRREIELALAEKLAAQLLERLPQSDADEEALIDSGRALANKMSWDVVAERNVLPACWRALGRRRVLKLA